MTLYKILFCLLFTEFLFGSFHVVESQSTTPELTSSVTNMTSATSASVSSASTSGSNSSFLTPSSPSSSTTTANQSVVLTSVSPTSFLNNNVTEGSSSNSSSTNGSNSDSTKQSTSSAANTVTTNFTVSTRSSQHATSMTTMKSNASSDTTILGSTTVVAVNTSGTTASNSSSLAPTSVFITTSPVTTQTISSANHSTVATSNNSSASTSHHTVNGSATTREAVISTSHSASTSTATAVPTSANFTTGENNTTLAPVTATETSNNTWFTADGVTVETVSTTSSTVTSYSTTNTVSFSSADGGYSSGGAEKKDLGWVAAPVIIGVLLIVAIIVVVLLVRRRRQRKQRSSKFVSLERRQRDQPNGVMNPSFRLDADDVERAPPAPVRVEDFVNHVDELRRDSDYGFASEFTALTKMSPQNSKSAAELPENRTKNRFTNILPFDHSRVKLIPADDDENGGSDYINASFLPGFSSRREFIAAQGPMKSTVDDFWRMIWEYNVTTVVMVTNLFERGREKCVQYWPEENEPIYYGDIQVELKSESSLNYYIIRVLNVTLEESSRRVMHYQFLTWPDFGVPKEHSHLLSFLTQVRSSLHPTTNQPVLVHCSAGVGRTGTFILIDHVLQLIRRNSDIDLFGLVLDMRNSRSNMIQTEAQYIFAHECIKYAIELGYPQGRDIFTSSDGISTGETQDESLYMNTGQGNN